MSKPFSNRELTNILMQPLHSLRNAQGRIIREREGSVSKYEKHSHVVTHPQSASTTTHTHTHAIQPKTPVTASQNSPVTHTHGATTTIPGHADVYRTMGYKFVDGHKIQKSSVRDPKITNNLANYMSKRKESESTNTLVSDASNYQSRGKAYSIEGSSHIVRKSGHRIVGGNTFGKDSQVHYTSPTKAEHTVTGDPALHYTSPSRITNTLASDCVNFTSPTSINVASHRPNILHEHVKGYESRVRCGRVSEQKVFTPKPVEVVATPVESVTGGIVKHVGEDKSESSTYQKTVSNSRRAQPNANLYSGRSTQFSEYNSCRLNQAERNYSSNKNPLDHRVIPKAFCNLVKGDGVTSGKSTAKTSLTNRTHKTFIFEGIKHDVNEGESITAAINRVTGKASKISPQTDRKSSEVIKPNRGHSPARATVDNYLQGNNGRSVDGTTNLLQGLNVKNPNLRGSNYVSGRGSEGFSKVNPGAFKRNDNTTKNAFVRDNVANRYASNNINASQEFPRVNRNSQESENFEIYSPNCAVRQYQTEVKEAFISSALNSQNIRYRPSGDNIYNSVEFNRRGGQNDDYADVRRMCDDLRKIDQPNYHLNNMTKEMDNLLNQEGDVEQEKTEGLDSDHVLNAYNKKISNNLLIEDLATRELEEKELNQTPRELIENTTPLSLPWQPSNFENQPSLRISKKSKTVSNKSEVDEVERVRFESQDIQESIVVEVKVDGDLPEMEVEVIVADEVPKNEAVVEAEGKVDEALPELKVEAVITEEPEELTETEEALLQKHCLAAEPEAVFEDETMMRIMTEENYTSVMDVELVPSVEIQATEESVRSNPSKELNRSDIIESLAGDLNVTNTEQDFTSDRDLPLLQKVDGDNGLYKIGLGDLLEELKSKNMSDEETNAFSVTNQSQQPLVLYRADKNGDTNEEQTYNLKESSNMMLKTTPGHAWVLMTLDKKYLCVYIVPSYLDNEDRVSMHISKDSEVDSYVSNSTTLVTKDLEEKMLGLKSKQGKSFNFEFKNLTLDAVTINWINSEGVLRIFYTAAPNEFKKIIGNYNNHYVVSKFEDGKLLVLGLYTPDENADAGKSSGLLLDSDGTLLVERVARGSDLDCDNQVENKKVVQFYNYEARGYGVIVKAIMEYLGADYREILEDAPDVFETEMEEKPQLPYMIDRRNCDEATTDAEAETMFQVSGNWFQLVKYIIENTEGGKELAYAFSDKKEEDVVSALGFMLEHETELAYQFSGDQEDEYKEKMSELLRTWCESEDNSLLKSLSQLLGPNDWLVSNKLSIMDFLLWEVVNRLNRIHYSMQIFHGPIRFRNLLLHNDRINDLPEIRNWMNSDRYDRTTPFNLPSAVWK